MVTAATKTRGRRGAPPPLKPIVNPQTRPCVVCGNHFWHITFHRNRISQVNCRKTCGEGCRYLLVTFNSGRKPRNYDN